MSNVAYTPGPAMRIAIAEIEQAADIASPLFAPSLRCAAEALAKGEKPSGSALRFAVNLLTARVHFWRCVDMETPRGRYLRPVVTRAADPERAAALQKVLDRLQQ